MRRRLLPSKLVFVDHHRAPHWYTISHRWDGALLLRATQKLDDSPSLMIVDYRLPFRRRFELPKGKRISRDILQSLAGDLFPIPTDSASFATGFIDERQYLFALPEGELRALQALIEKPPRSILVAGAGVVCLREALVKWSQLGPLCDFLAAPRPLSRSVAMSVALIVATIGVLAAGATSLRAEYAEAQQARAVRDAEVERKARPLARRHQAIAHMLAAHGALERLSTPSYARARASVSRFLQDLPVGVEIRSIVYDGESIEITGWEDRGRDWLAQAAAELTISSYEELPERNYFKLRTQVTAQQQ